ncbi:MAG UNVERIFIED_CONTAM: hypothetical protein LVR18_50110 [Planctomycetaceae bacterium]
MTTSRLVICRAARSVAPAARLSSAAFHCGGECLWSAGDQADDQSTGNAEGRRAFAGIKDTEAS